MKTFTCELKSLPGASDFWLCCHVWYEDGFVYRVEDELGREHAFSTLSPFNREIVEKHLILNLTADLSAVRTTYDLLQ